VIARSLRRLGLAFAFLTILPVRLTGEPPPLGVAAGWFAAVGALVAALAGALGYLVEPSLGATPAAAVAVGALVILTGGLHQDGLADCADGIGARGDRQRRLEIMRDSSIGTFGALALGLYLILLISLLAAFDREHALRALVVAAATARAAALIHATLAKPARTDGLGAAFTVHPAALAFASVSAIAIALAIAGPADGAAAIAAAAAVAILVSAWSNHTLGGRTGDTLGATVALAELAAAAAILAAS
jgi:adenosylcobinamide-GDP ribazoletransferase